MTTGTSETELRSRPMGGRQSSSHWRSVKRQRTMSLSDDAWDLLTGLAENTGLNRSEIIEVGVRYLQEQQSPLKEIRSGLLAEMS